MSQPLKMTGVETSLSRILFEHHSISMLEIVEFLEVELVKAYRGVMLWSNASFTLDCIYEQPLILML